MTNASKRRGSLIAECLVAMVVAGFGLAVAAQIITLSHVQRRSIEARGIAAEEAANLAERISVLPYDQLEQAAAWQLSETAGQLPHPQLTIELHPEPAATRIRILVQWRTDGPAPLHESLVLWRNRP